MMEVVPALQKKSIVLVGLFLLASLFLGYLIRRHSISQQSATTISDVASAPRDLVIADEVQLQQISIEHVLEGTISVDKSTTGRLTFNEDRLTPVFTPYSGRAIELLANKGMEVQRGQPLIILESPDLVSAQNDLASARSDLAKSKIGLDVAKTAVERARRLHEQEALATKDLQQAEADLARTLDEQKRAQVALAAVENRLLLFGKKPQEIAELANHVDNRVTLRAPISGTIVDRKIGPGQYVKPDSPDPLFLISDLSTLWVLADVFESDLAGIHLNAPAEVKVAAFPNRTFPAQISYLSPTVDPLTRTVRVRCLLKNSDRRLKPDMFATIKIESASQRSVPLLPATAVISEGQDSLVFVEEGHGHFRRRPIKVGEEVDGHVVVLAGIRPGERIATRGSLLLNELTKPKG